MTRPFALLAAAATLGLSAGQAKADLIFFNSRPTFNAAAPGLPVETFENNVRPNNNVFTFPEPLNSTSNNGSFTPGSILPGVNIGIAAPGTQTLVLLTQGAFGVASDVVGPAAFADDLELTFAPGVTAVGFDILAPDGGTAQPFTVSIFGAGNILLGSQAVTATAGPSFFGVISTSDLITRITITDPPAAGRGELIDNLAFGQAAASAIPEPATLAVFAGLAGVGGLVARRRKLARA